jgi:hypothetical protein
VNIHTVDCRQGENETKRQSSAAEGLQESLTSGARRRSMSEMHERVAIL